MKLSMWIIANLLDTFDPEIHIQEDSPRILRSARRFYATDCVYVRQDGTDCVMSFGDDYIKIADLPAWEGVELLQSIFDSMFDWHSQITAAIEARNYQQLVDQCHVVFKCPVILQDANQRCLAASSQYGPRDVDEEWYHLKTYGYSSFNSSRLYTHFQSHRMITNRLIQYHFSPESNCFGYISAPIVHDGLPNGSLSVIEKDRVLNPGHMQLLTLLTDLLTPAMCEENISGDTNSPFLKSVLEGSAISQQTAQQIFSHKHWQNDHHFRVIICDSNSTINDEWFRRNYFLSSALTAAFPEDLCGVYDNLFVILANDTLLPNENRLERLKLYLKDGDMKIAFSLPFPGIEYVPLLLQQAQFALKFGCRQTRDTLSLDFYHYAVDYLIRSSYSPQLCLTACHPDIHALRSTDETLYETLRVYLIEDRSVTRTIQQLYIHKNTLLYRIRKIEELLNFSLTDAYNREYMRLSFRLLDYHTDLSNSTNNTI